MHVTWTHDACDRWNNREDFIRYPRSMQLFLLGQLKRDTSIESISLAIEEDNELDHSHTQHFSSTLSNATIIEFTGSIKNVMHCVEALSASRHIERVHLGTWDYWTLDDFLQALNAVIRLTTGPQHENMYQEVKINNDINSAATDEIWYRPTQLEHSSYELAIPILARVVDTNISTLSLDPNIDMFLPADFLETFANARNLETLSIGGGSAQWFPPSTEVTFDDVIKLTQKLKKLKTLYIPWITSDQEPSVDAEEAGSTAVDNEKKPAQLQTLGYPCFHLDLDWDLDLTYIDHMRTRLPLLKDIVVLSCYLGSWEGGALSYSCMREESDAVNIREYWVQYREVD
jgi:hypothetical protein